MSGEGDILAGAVIGPEGFINEEGGVKYMRKHTGATLSPGNANELSRRMSRLPVIMEQHCGNARYLSDNLRMNEDVERVFFPDLGKDSRAGYAGGVFSFTLTGDNAEERFEREKAFIEHASKKGGLQHRVSLGMPDTLIVGYANLLTGFGHDYEEVKDIMGGLGIPIGLVRVSAGREQDRRGLKSAFENAIEYANR